MPADVSIIIPSYNGQEFIEKTIESCLNQTYKYINILVIDDNSTDSTRDLLSAYGDEVALIFNNENLGIVKNVNHGVNLIQTDYFLLLGHDDVLVETHVEKMLNEFEPGVVSVHCNSVLINGKGEETGVLFDDSTQIIKNSNSLFELSIENYISSCGMLHKTSVFKEVNGWDERYLHYGEWLYYIKSLEYGKIKYTTSTQAYYRRHDTNITNTFRSKSVLRKLHMYMDECRCLAHYMDSGTITKNLIYHLNRAKVTFIRMVPQTLKQFVRRLK